MCIVGIGLWISGSCRGPVFEQMSMIVTESFAVSMKTVYFEMMFVCWNQKPESSQWKAIL